MSSLKICNPILQRTYALPVFTYFQSQAIGLCSANSKKSLAPVVQMHTNWLQIRIKYKEDVNEVPSRKKLMRPIFFLLKLLSFNLTEIFPPSPCIMSNQAGVNSIPLI